MMIGNPTGASGGDSVTISPGSSGPDNGKFFIPDTLTVAKGTTVTWINDDSTLHTVTSKPILKVGECPQMLPNLNSTYSGFDTSLNFIL